MASHKRKLDWTPDTRTREILAAPIENPKPKVPRLRVDSNTLPRWSMKPVPVNPRRDRNGPYPSNDGYTYRGRGIVQVTGRGNYAKIDAMFGTDTVDNPDTMATNSQLLANVIVWGMTGGNFTGASLNQYVNSSQQDYYNARRTVNGIFPNDAASKAEASTVQTYSQKYAPIVDANC